MPKIFICEPCRTGDHSSCTKTIEHLNGGDTICQCSTCIAKNFAVGPYTHNNVESKPREPYTLKYKDFKRLEKIIEEYHLDDKGDVDFNSIPQDEKELLWKIKTIIRNMESVRLR